MTLRKLPCGDSPCIQIASVGGVYVHMLVFKESGDANEGHAHTYDHVTLIAPGSRIAIESNGRRTEFEGPHLVVIPAGVAHRMIALEPWSTAVCIHALHAKDNPGDIIDPASVPEGTPPWAFAVPVLESESRKQGFTLNQGVTK